MRVNKNRKDKWEANGRMRLGIENVTLLREENEQLTGLTVHSPEKSGNAGGNEALVFGAIGRSIQQAKLIYMWLWIHRSHNACLSFTHTLT